MVAGPDPLRSEMMGELVRPGLHLTVGASLAVGHEVFPLGIGVDGRLEQVGEVELHPTEIRTRSCSVGNRSSTPAQGGSPTLPAGTGPAGSARQPPSYPLIPTMGWTSLMEPVEPKKAGPPVVGYVKTPPSEPLR